MKLYIVNLKNPVSYVNVRDTASKTDPVALITVVEPDLAYEFQSEAIANIVASEFDGTVKVIDYDVSSFYY
jgi:hypothetical protein